MEIVGTKFTTISEIGNVITFDLGPLKPDGSGRIVWKDGKGHEFFYDFDAGVGPRKIRASSALGVCVWLYEPIP